MANRRYGRNQKRRHRELVKQLEVRNKTDLVRFNDIVSDLKMDLSVYSALTECTVDHFNKLYVSPSDGDIPTHDLQSREHVILKKVRARDLVDLDDIEHYGQDYFSFRKKELESELLEGVRKYISVKEQKEFRKIMIEAVLVFESGIDEGENNVCGLTI